MKRNSKVAALGCTVALASVVLAGCSPASTDPGTTLTMAWQAGDWAFIDQGIAQFEEEHPGVKVELTKLQDADLQTTVSTQLLAGNGPDVSVIWVGGGNPMGVQKLAPSGLLAPLDDLEWVSSADPTAVSQGTVDGSVYMATPGGGPTAAIWNVGAIEEVGLEVPTTWDELLQFCTDARAAGKTPLGLGLQNGWTTFPLVYALLAGELEDQTAVQNELADGSFDFTTSEAWTSALEKQSAMVSAGCFQDSPVGTDIDTGVLPLVASGEMLGVVSVSAHAGVIQEQAASPLDLLITPVPTGATPADSKLFLSWNNGYGVNAKSKHLDLAKELVATFLSAENLNAYGIENASLPSVPNDGFKAPAALAAATPFVADGATVSGDYLPGADTFPAFSAGIQNLVLGTQTVEQVLASLQAAYISSF